MLRMVHALSSAQVVVHHSLIPSIKQSRFYYASVAGCIPHFAIGTELCKKGFRILSVGGKFWKFSEVRQWNAIKKHGLRRWLRT
jgi:hypothetical protein